MRAVMSLPAPTAAGEAEAERGHVSAHPWALLLLACCELWVPSSSLSPSSPAPHTGSLHGNSPEPCQLLGATARLCPPSPWADVELRPAECSSLGLCPPGKEPASCWAAACSRMAALVLEPFSLEGGCGFDPIGSHLPATEGSRGTAACGQGQCRGSRGHPACCWGKFFLRLISAFCCCRVCEQPASMEPHEWPDDITKWPVSIAGGTEPVRAAGLQPVDPTVLSHSCVRGKAGGVSSAASYLLSQTPDQGSHGSV